MSEGSFDRDKLEEAVHDVIGEDEDKEFFEGVLELSENVFRNTSEQMNHEERLPHDVPDKHDVMMGAMKNALERVPSVVQPIVTKEVIKEVYQVDDEEAHRLLNTTLLSEIAQSSSAGVGMDLIQGLSGGQGNPGNLLKVLSELQS